MTPPKPPKCTNPLCHSNSAYPLQLGGFIRLMINIQKSEAISNIFVSINLIFASTVLQITARSELWKFNRN